MPAKMKMPPMAPVRAEIDGGGGAPRTTRALKTKGRAHYEETMKIAERIMDERAELFRRLADA